MIYTRDPSSSTDLITVEMKNQKSKIKIEEAVRKAVVSELGFPCISSVGRNMVVVLEITCGPRIYVLYVEKVGLNLKCEAWNGARSCWN